MPVGTSNGPPNGSSEVEGEGGNGEKDERASGIADPSLDDDSGDEDIHHTYVVPNPTQLTPYPNKPRPPPPSMSLEGEISDAVHNPDGQTDSPDSVPPSVQLKGEKNKASSLNVEVDDVKMDDNHTQPPSRHPVGTTDGDERRPSEPTEPPDEKEGEQGANGKLRRVKVEHVKGVEDVESRELR
ncbi:hypothetical protein PAXINDRAFT_16890 [Paxillus involutus ATCC 200175]|uniref:Uncharacterized protein n=1 Tax=Paxillus involutus ATCC 200175 TaxID=664439 RepID=A0A0C9TH43_PAXIN|nr:hypothetical protein PAXINDRAFT_16890 [Paxillus involutus ATCC 200175]